MSRSWLLKAQGMRVRPWQLPVKQMAAGRAQSAQRFPSSIEATEVLVWPAIRFVTENVSYNTCTHRWHSNICSHAAATSSRIPVCLAREPPAAASLAVAVAASSLAAAVGGNVFPLVGVVFPARQQRCGTLGAVVHTRRLWVRSMSVGDGQAARGQPASARQRPPIHEACPMIHHTSHQAPT